jgi:proline iminopeptidase
MRTLYPEIEPFHFQHLRVDELHQLYFEQSGNPQGIPVIFLHGGPGSGSSTNHRRYFDPARYHIINFDQRGCNRSIPKGCVEKNTSQDLVRDIELLRQHLQLDKWLVFGGSWGATLGLLYTESYPERVSGLILRGAFLARQADLDWFISNGANRIFPDYWNEFVQFIPAQERDDLVAAYHKRVHGQDKVAQEQAAIAWSTWAGRIVTHMLAEVNPDTYKPDDIETTIHEVLIETHYALNSYFIQENQILNDIDLIPDIPITIIHGRKDLTCTLEASWLLHQALPGSDFLVLKDAGHLAGERPMVDALIRATDNMAGLSG